MYLHKEILTNEQIKLLSLVKLFNKDFGLVGGTAIALHIGHRESLDFDLFCLKKFGNMQLRNIISDKIKIDDIIVNKLGEFTILIKGVKITFFHYPFHITFSEKFDNIAKIPDILTLGAMKAHALGMRAKWKDYVDLYFIMKDFCSIEGIIKKTKDIFKNEFNERMFRTQLSYFEDIDYQEKIIWMKGFEVKDEVIKKELTKFSLL